MQENEQTATAEDVIESVESAISGPRPKGSKEKTDHRVYGQQTDPTNEPGHVESLSDEELRSQALDAKANMKARRIAMGEYAIRVLNRSLLKPKNGQPVQEKNATKAIEVLGLRLLCGKTVSFEGYSEE